MPSVEERAGGYLYGNFPHHLAKRIREDLKRRTEKGIETYGEPLGVNNGRDALTDLYEELLDALQYTAQSTMEGRLHVKEEEVISGGLRSALLELTEVMSRREKPIGFLKGEE